MRGGKWASLSVKKGQNWKFKQGEREGAREGGVIMY